MMADNQNHQFNTDHIRDLLSPYLDGEVTQEERAQVEQALAASAELQQELEILRRMVALVVTLPVIPAPRPFTLTETAGKSVIPSPKSFFGLPGWFKGVAGLAAMLLCVVTAAGIFWSMQFGGASQPAAEIANAPAIVPTTVAPEAQSAAAPVQPAAKEEAAPAGSAARQAPTQTAAATEETMMAAAESAVTPAIPTAAASAAALVMPSADEAAKQAASPSADEAPAAEGQAITATQADQSDRTEQSLAAQEAPAAAPGMIATPSPAPTVLTFAAPAQEAPQEKVGGEAESAETGQMTGGSAVAPTEPLPQEKPAAGAEAQTDQLTAESESAPTEAPAPELLELKQSAPSPTPTATLMPQPSATPVALPAAATPIASVTPASLSQNAPTNFWLVAGLVVMGLLVIAGLVIWLVSSKSRQ